MCAGVRDGEKMLKRPANPDLRVFQIPGVSFVLPTTTGPLEHFPAFTSRHTAKMVWVSIVAALASTCAVQAAWGVLGSSHLP